MAELHHMMNHTMMNHTMMNHTMHNMSSTTAMAHNHHHMTTTAMNHNHHNMGGMDNGQGGHNHGGPMDMNSTHCIPDMLMYFHTGFCEYVLLETFQTKNSGGVVGACFAIFALAVIYEGLKVLREHLLQKSMVDAAKYKVTNGTSSSQDAMVVSHTNVGVHMMSCGHLLQTVLHMIQVFISYCLMLVFMTYNVWFCLAVIVGAGCGYFLFGWRKAIVVDINEHCH